MLFPCHNGREVMRGNSLWPKNLPAPLRNPWRGDFDFPPPNHPLETTKGRELRFPPFGFPPRAALLQKVSGGLLRNAPAARLPKLTGRGFRRITLGAAFRTVPTAYRRKAYFSTVNVLSVMLDKVGAGLAVFCLHTYHLTEIILYIHYIVNRIAVVVFGRKP